ncbi:MAG: SAM-dependent methyltransferase [Ilumatobacteraceae bacterium]
MSTTSREFSERRYSETEDPWSFASNEYEQQRYATILGFVPHGRFRRAFEPGCSVGELTARLAARCGFVTATDGADAAVEAARDRCSGLDNVDVHQGSLLDAMPRGPFDLIVFSEIGYNFVATQLIELAHELASRIEPRGQLIAVHWTGASPDHVLPGRVVHEILREHLPMEHLHHENHESDDRDGFVLDMWRRRESTLASLPHVPQDLRR